MGSPAPAQAPSSSPEGEGMKKGFGKTEAY